MVTVAKPAPIAEVQKEYDRNCAIGILIKASYDARPPEKGVTHLPPLEGILWNKGAQRWRYAKGFKNIAGKNVGGRFAKPTARVIAQRKGYSKKKKKR